MSKVSFFQRLERLFIMLRHIPPNQLLRRIELTLRYRLAPWLPDGGAAAGRLTLVSNPPLPIFAPRRLLEPVSPDRLRFRQPWGACEIARPVNWRLPGEGALAAAWRSNLHYMEHLEGTDDELFQEIVLSWIEHNPRRARGAWRFAWRPYNLSIRTVVWMQQIASRLDRLDPGFIERACVSLAEQLRFLEIHLETDIRGNHLLRNTKALLWGAHFFAGPEAERWQKLARHHLMRELEHQILADGCHYELSPSYHCQVMGDLLECRSILEPGPARDRLDEALGRMARALCHLVHTDGLVALQNDGGLGMAYAPGELLHAHERISGCVTPMPEGGFSLPEAGFFGLHAGRDYLLVDCGPIGPDALIGHGHGDILGLEWSVDGKRILVDQGTFQHDDHPRRVTSRATVSHNTVTIGDAEQCDFFGAHRCGRRAGPELRQVETGGDIFRFVGSHDGFEHLSGRPRPVREIEARKGMLVVRDRIEGGGEQVPTARYLLHPDCALASSDGAKLVFKREGMTIEVIASVDIQLDEAEWFPDLYVSCPTTRLILEGTPGTSFVEARFRRTF